jgi:hypothetical protein
MIQTYFLHKNNNYLCFRIDKNGVGDWLCDIFEYDTTAQPSKWVYVTLQSTPIQQARQSWHSMIISGWAEYVSLRNDKIITKQLAAIPTF